MIPMPSQSLSEEKRSSIRSSLNLHPIVRVEAIQGEAVQVFKACLLEIGRTGLSLELINPVTPGTPVTVFLESIPAIGVTKVSGVVKWLAPLDLKDSCGECGFRVGLRLAELLPELNQATLLNSIALQSSLVTTNEFQSNDGVSNPSLLVDKRGFFRLKRSLPIRLYIPHQRKTSHPAMGGYDIIAHDINEGGLLTEILIPDHSVLQDMMANMREANLEIRFPEQDQVFTVKAKPVWFKSQNDLIDHRMACGFRFIDLRQSDRKTISDYIEREKGRTKFDRLKTFPLFIGGEDVDTWDYEYFPYAEKMILDFKSTYRMIVQMKKGEKPAGYEDFIFARYCVGGLEINQRAMEAAHKASLIFRRFSIETRKKILLDIRDLLVSNRDQLIELLTVEGHSRKLAEWEFQGMERAFQTQTIEFFSQDMWREMRNGDEHVAIVRKADGVVCVSPPKNASCSNSLLAAFALLGGNAIIIKPPLKMPISTIFLWREVIYGALKKNGAPEGCVNIVVGNSKTFMEQWLESPLVNDLIYFGDSETGLEIGRQAYLKGKKPILELSGNDIVFVWKDADVPKAVASVLDAFLGSMQICMVPKNAFVHHEIYEKFLEVLTGEVRRLKMGLPSSEETYFTPVIKTAEFFDFLQDALMKGAQLVCGGKRVDHTGEPSKSGLYLEPTLLRLDHESTAKTARVVLEENFFPLFPVVKVSGSSDDEVFEKMLGYSNANRFGLRTSVWVRSKRIRGRFVQELDNTGLLRINTRHVAFSMFTSTHGGTRQSGGPYGEMNYVWQKTSHLQGIVYREEQP